MRIFAIKGAKNKKNSGNKARCKKTIWLKMFV